MDRRIRIALIITGIAVGLLAYFSPGGLFFILLAILTAFFINRIPDKSERNFLLVLFLAGFGARVFLTLATMAVAIFDGHILNCVSYTCPNYSTPYLIDDSGYYTLRGIFTSMYWKGEPLSRYTVEAVVKNVYGASGFTYLLAAYFTLFGYSPITSRFINCLFGIFIAIIVYYIVKDIFGRNPAMIAAVLTAFFPSLFFWSATNLKETSFTILVYIMLWGVIKFKKLRKIRYLVIVTVSILLQISIRRGYDVFNFFTAALISTYFLCLFIAYLLRTKKLLLFSILIITCGFIVVSRVPSMDLTLQDTIYKAVIMHKGSIGLGKHFQLLTQEQLATGNVEPIYFIKMLVEGWFHAMFEPFPWNIQSMAMALVVYQVLIWYILVFFSLSGIIIGLRHRLSDTSILILYFIGITSGLAVTTGNIGTVFRLRDVVTPIILIFSSVGLVNIFNRLDLNKENNRIS